MTTPLQPLIDAALPRVPIILSPGEYDDAEPVRINKSVCIIGPRTAIIHSEIDVEAGDAHFVGMTARMNKVGAPMHTGMTDFYPQNGMFQARCGGHLWLDDMQIDSLLGFSKPAIHVNGARLHLRARTQFSALNWINNTGPIIELLYGSYANVFGTGDDTMPINLQSGCAAGIPAITVASSYLVLSGSNMWKGVGAAGTLAINSARGSYVQVGAGAYTTIQGFGPVASAIQSYAASQLVLGSPYYIG